MSSKLLEVQNLLYRYEDFEILLPKFEINEGDVKSLTGASGSGKSTILECLGLIRQGYEASVFKLCGIDIKELQHSSAKLAKLRSTILGFMPQTGGLLPFLTLRDNIKLVKDLAGVKSSYADDLCKILGINDLLDKYPHMLSIGQRQRGVFVKAIAHMPKVLLIDEPTSALDPYNSKLLIQEIKSISQSYGIGSIIVTHDLDLVADLPKYQKTILENADSIKTNVNNTPKIINRAVFLEHA